jgi:hypothetical protein
MTASRKEDKKSRAPYEPPKLFNLGGGIAHAQGACSVGGSPGFTQCNSGGAASGGRCKTGTTASGQCSPGMTAASGCKAGGKR